MEGIFTLPFSEFGAILQVQKLLKKHEGYSVFIPVSRQQKGVDFLILNTRRNTVLKVQVKSSRAYESLDTEQIEKGKKYKYTLWFHNVEPGESDWYMLFGLYPVYSVEGNIKSREKFWKTMILAFTDDEMKWLLQQRNKDRFFYIAFNGLSEVLGTRGFREKRLDLTHHLLPLRKDDLLRELE